MRMRALLLGLVGASVVATASAGPELVDFPQGWETSFSLAATRDMHRGGKTIAEIFVNATGVTSGPGDVPLASGTVIVMKLYRARIDAGDQLVRDDAGRLVKGDATGALLVMEKRSGWGADYGAVRNGEWEYASFGIGGERRQIENKGCLECHGALTEFDYVFTRYEIAELRR